MNKITTHFHIDSDKLAEITNIINRDTDPAVTEDVILAELLSDWNEDKEHSEFINNATAEEIANWLKSFYIEG